MSVTIATILEELNQREIAYQLIGADDPDREPLDQIHIERLSDDSRRCDPATIYSLTSEGIGYLKSAIERGVPLLLADQRGASAALAAGRQFDVPLIMLVEDLFVAQGMIAASLHDHPAERLHIVGVTGTNGKTSVTRMLFHLWQAYKIPAAVIGTLGVLYSRRDGSVVERVTGYTTPRMGDLQAIFAELLDAGVTHLAMEVSSEAILLGRITGVPFDVAIFTNLTPEHLNVHHTMEDYFAVKMELIDQTARRGGKVVIAALDEFGERAAAIARSIAPATTVVVHESLIEAVLDKLLPNFHKINLTLALLALPEELRNDHRTYKAIDSLPEVPGRFNLFVSAEDELCHGIVDYAHTADALENLLRSARAMGYEQMTLLFGCGGDRDPSKREAMGRIAARLADSLIVTDDNPRREDPASIRAVIAAAARDEAQRAGREIEIIELADRRNAIYLGVMSLKAVVGKKRCLIVAGKGHESVQIFADRNDPFSDAEHLSEAFGITCKKL